MKGRKCFHPVISLLTDLNEVESYPSGDLLIVSGEALVEALPEGRVADRIKCKNRQGAPPAAEL